MLQVGATGIGKEEEEYIKERDRFGEDRRVQLNLVRKK
jgi:hypothetical protein